MQFPSILISLVLATAVVAKGKDKEAVTDTQKCREITGLNALVALAANTTKLDAVTKGNATKAEAIQAKASAASTTLTTLTSNTTLMSACEIIDAADRETDQCQQQFVLSKFVKFAANETAVASATKNNATKIANIQLKASDAAAKLQTLESNATLQAYCPAVFQDDECKIMDGLMKFVALANNQTKLDKVTHGNTTKEDKIKANAVKAQDQLTAMMNNATFVAVCKDLKEKKQQQKGSSNTQDGISSKSAAAFLSTSGAVSTMLVVFLGMLIL